MILTDVKGNDDFTLQCNCEDGTMIVIDLKKLLLYNYPYTRQIFENPSVFKNVSILPKGNGICWNNDPELRFPISALAPLITDNPDYKNLKGQISNRKKLCGLLKGFAWTATVVALGGVQLFLIYILEALTISKIAINNTATKAGLIFIALGLITSIIVTKYSVGFKLKRAIGEILLYVPLVVVMGIAIIIKVVVPSGSSEPIINNDVLNALVYSSCVISLVYALGWRTLFFLDQNR